MSCFANRQPVPSENARNSMRIGVDARPLAGPIDGIGRYTEELVSRLINRSNHYFVLFTNETTRKAWGDSERTTVVNVPNHPLPEVVNKALWPLTMARVLHRHGLNAFWSPRHHIPVWTTRVACAVSVHDLSWIDVPETMPPMRVLQEKLLFPRSMRKASAIFCISNSTAGALQKHLPNESTKMHILYPAPASNASHVSQAAVHSKPYFLAVGTIEPRKNYIELLKAFRIAAKQIPHSLVIVGRPGWGDIGLQELIKQLNLKHRVEWLPDASDNTLFQLMKNATALVSSSVYEGFGLPVLEALSLGTMVIASDIPPHREVLADSGWHYSLGNTEQLGELLIRADEQRSSLDALAEERAKRASDFSWDRTADAMLHIFERLHR